jgi:hypothetical protein
MAKIGQQLIAKRAGCATEQPYDNGTVTKVTRNGVFYTTVNNKFTYKWQPHKRYTGYYLRYLMFEGKPLRMAIVSFLELTFNDKETV